VNPPPAAAHPPPPAGAGSLWAWRGFVLASVARDFRMRYTGSLLGGAWAILSPLSQIVIYTVIFSQLMHARLPEVEGGWAYSIHICGGIVVWGVFNEVLQRGLSLYTDHADLIRKVRFPHLTLLAAIVLTAGLHALIMLGLLLGFLALVGLLPGAALLAVLPILALTALLAAGAGLLLGLLNVYVRDVGAMAGVALQFLFWATPIVYPLQILPPWAAQWVALNPLTPLVGGVQAILLGGAADWPALGAVLLLALLLAALALLQYRRLDGDVADLL
jgi:lipopolysaccharide transport system permease protein